MAQSRLISRRLTESDKIARLHGNDMARFIYCALLPYTDRAGRVQANGHGLNATVFEGFGYRAEDIDSALLSLARVGLIVLYSTPRYRQLLEYVRFRDFNTPHPKEPESELPGPNDEGSAVLDAEDYFVDEPPSFPARHPGKPTGKAGPDSSPGEVAGVMESNPVDLNPVDLTALDLPASPTTQGLSPPTYAASPRSLDLASGLAKPGLTESKSGTHPQHEALLAVWNEHRGSLAGHRVVDDHRAKGFTDLIRTHGFEEAQNLLRDAALYVREYDVYLDGNHGLNALLRQGRLVSYAELTRQGMKPKPRGDPAVDRHVAAADRADGLAAHIQRTRGVQP